MSVGLTPLNFDVAENVPGATVISKHDSKCRWLSLFSGLSL